MSGWRDISTAPKDGSWIIVFEPSDIEPCVHVVRWHYPEWHMGDPPAKQWVTMALGPNPDTYEAEGATHWMPIPQPPAPNKDLAE